MRSIPPEFFFLSGLIVLGVQILCGLAVASSLTRGRSGGPWRTMKWAVRGTSTAGLGIALIFLLVFIRRRPGAVTEGDRWLMTAGLIAAIVGQLAVLLAMLADHRGAFARAPDERGITRAYLLAAPVITAVLGVALWFARGMK